MGKVLQFRAPIVVPAGSVPAEEIYSSITNQGLPALFLRLPGSDIQNVGTQSFEDIQKGVKKAGRLVITSLVDPLIHQSVLVDMLRYLEGSHWVEIYTNGATEPTDSMDVLVDHYHIFPTLEALFTQPYQANLDQFIYVMLEVRRSFHFRVRVDHMTTDMKKVRDFAKKYEVPRWNIFLSSDGDLRAHMAGLRALAEYCVKEGYGYSPRLRILAGGRE